MKKLILAASLLAPLAAAPAFAQVDSTPDAAVTQYQTQGVREFAARRNVVSQPAGVTASEQVQIDRQGAPGSF